MMKEDLLSRLKLSENVLFGVFDSANRYLLDEDFGNWETAHNIGRLWEALLCMEAFCHTQIPKEIESAMEEHIRAFTNNSYGLLLCLPSDPNAKLNYHNLREAMLSFAALVRFRHSRWASYAGLKLIDTIEKLFFDHTLTDADILQSMDYPENIAVTKPSEDPYLATDKTFTFGRCMEGLLRFYQATKAPEALRLLNRCVEFHKKHTVNADGTPPEWISCPTHIGHNHSYLGTLRGLLLYGITFQDRSLIESIYLTWEKSIFRYNCDQTGFAPHDLGSAQFNDHFGDPLGDQASCADVCMIGFLLGTQCGHPEVLDTVERLIRCRLFRFQITEGKFAGAWGITSDYLGISRTIDVYTLIQSTLSLIYFQNLSCQENQYTLHLLFSAEKEGVSVCCDRDINSAKQHISVRSEKPIAFSFRLPAWCPQASLSIKADGAALPYSVSGGYVRLSEKDFPIRTTTEISFDLPKIESYSHTWRSEKQFRIVSLGDSVLSFDEISK